MISGLRAAPWFRELSRRGQLGIDDCGTCMQSTTQLQRQAMGCGYEPPADGRVHLTVWQPPTGNDRVGYRGPELTTCPGYTCNLPEVIEATVARAHWKNGALALWCEGEMPNEDLLNSILILDSEYSAAEAWLMTPSKDGGGGA